MVKGLKEISKKLSKLATRVTIMLDDDLVRKLRTKQAKLLQESKGSVSFSRVINDTLRPCLKK